MRRKYLIMFLGLAILFTLSFPTAATELNLTIRPFGTGFLVSDSLPVELGVPVADNLEFTVGAIWSSSVDKEIYPSNPENNDTDEYKSTFVTLGARYYFPVVVDLDTYILGQIGFGSYKSPYSDYTVQAYVLGTGAKYAISTHWAVVGELGIGWIINEDDSGIPIEKETNSTIGSTLALRYSF